MLILSCGNYASAAFEAQTILEVVLSTPGSLMLTPQQWSRLGHDYAVDPTSRDQHVFCNNENFLNGIRVAISEGYLTHDRFVVKFFPEDRCTPGAYFVITFDGGGAADDWPQGFFDQVENDLMKLF